MYGDQQLRMAGYVHKEFEVQLPAGVHMDFIPGSYAQIKIPLHLRWITTGYRQEPYEDEYCRHGRSSVSSVEVCQSGTDCACLLCGQLPG